MAWLHQRSFGTIGVYFADPPGDSRLLPARQWIRVCGTVQPQRVYARPDDPRTAGAPELAPLAVALGTIEPIEMVEKQGAAGNALLPQPQHVRLRTGRRCGPGALAPVARQPDLCYWQAAGRLLPPIAAWNRIIGVISRAGSQRILRYVVSAVPACAGEGTNNG